MYWASLNQYYGKQQTKWNHTCKIKTKKTKIYQYAMYIHLFYRPLYDVSSLTLGPIIFPNVFCHGFHGALTSGMKELQAMNNWLLGALQCTAWLVERVVERDGNGPYLSTPPLNRWVEWALPKHVFEISLSFFIPFLWCRFTVKRGSTDSLKKKLFANLDSALFWRVEFFWVLYKTPDFFFPKNWMLRLKASNFFYPWNVELILQFWTAKTIQNPTMKEIM